MTDAIVHFMLAVGLFLFGILFWQIISIIKIQNKRIALLERQIGMQRSPPQNPWTDPATYMREDYRR
jgi:hypothetical protein